MTDHPVYLTAEGLRKLEEDLDHLRRVKRVEVANRIHAALDEGGELRENAEYEAAKNEQAFVEGRILQLETMLSEAIIIQEKGPKGVVRLGSTVEISDEDSGDKEKYQIVGAVEADPKHGRISNESPFGRALLGKKKGDRVKVTTPEGEFYVEVLSVQ